MDFQPYYQSTHKRAIPDQLHTQFNFSKKKHRSSMNDLKTTFKLRTCDEERSRAQSTQSEPALVKFKGSKI
jgi:hypothetical protein